MDGPALTTTNLFGDVTRPDIRHLKGRDFGRKASINLNKNLKPGFRSQVLECLEHKEGGKY